MELGCCDAASAISATLPLPAKDFASGRARRPVIISLGATPALSASSIISLDSAAKSPTPKLRFTNTAGILFDAGLGRVKTLVDGFKEGIEF